MIIYVVCEAFGSHIVEAFTDEQDALSHLHWEEATGGLKRGHYTVKQTELKGLTP